MLKPLVRGALPAMLAGACALPLAHADIYTWTDESGRVNMSNLTPPEGVKVTRVVQESVPKVKVAPPREEPGPDALRDAEVRLLAERVRQLQDEVEAAKRQALREAEYRAIPAPPVIQYIQAPQYVQPPSVQYAAAPTPAGGNCGFGFDYADCGFGWWPGFYPASYVVVSAAPFRRSHPGRGDNPAGPRPVPIHGGGHVAPWMPIVAPGTGRAH
jgi:hypothetical protein